MQIERTPKHVKARRRKETSGNTTSVRTGHTPHLYGDIASLSRSLSFCFFVARALCLNHKLFDKSNALGLATEEMTVVTFVLSSSLSLSV